MRWPRIVYSRNRHMVNFVAVDSLRTQQSATAANRIGEMPRAFVNALRVGMRRGFPNAVVHQKQYLRVRGVDAPIVDAAGSV